MGKIVRIGTVHSVNSGKRKVRVYFEEEDIMSGWLKVIKSPPFIIPSADESLGVTNGNDETDTASLHRHSLNIIPWFPKIGDTVLCLYNPEFNSDGYVIGGL